MKHMTKIKAGDRVYWEGSPNEQSVNLNGTVLRIKKGVAEISKDFSDDTRLVNVKILKKYEDS